VALGRRAEEEEEDDEGRRRAEEEGRRAEDVKDVKCCCNGSKISLFPPSLLSGLPDFGGIITAFWGVLIGLAGKFD
jgi:hypothetical protein